MATVLLDTHTLIWMVTDEDKLGEQAKDLLFDSAVRKLLSPASYWEIAIKMKLGKLDLTVPYDDFVAEAIDEYKLEVLHIHHKHTSLLTTLDLFHADPFDRLLVVQASIEGVPIISIDDKLDPYPVTRLWDYDADSDETDGNSEEAS